MPYGYPYAGAGATYPGAGDEQVISKPVPAVEQDKTARLQSIFQGIQGFFTSAEEVYQRIKYSPKPSSDSRKTRDYGDNSHGTYGPPSNYPPPTSANGFDLSQFLTPQYLLIGVAVFAAFYFLKK